MHAQVGLRNSEPAKKQLKVTHAIHKQTQVLQTAALVANLCNKIAKVGRTGGCPEDQDQSHHCHIRKQKQQYGTTMQAAGDATHSFHG
jgi:hypothetical protein